MVQNISLLGIALKLLQFARSVDGDAVKDVFLLHCPSRGDDNISKGRWNHFLCIFKDSLTASTPDGMRNSTAHGHMAVIRAYNDFGLRFGDAPESYRNG